MTGDDYARLFYISLLLLVIGGSFFASNRQNLGKTAQQAAVWVLIFVGAIAVVGLWTDIRGDLLPRQTVYDGQTIETPRQADNHYYLTIDVNGTPIDFLVDTGATQIVMSQADAARAGIDTNSLAFVGQAQTANGIVRTAPVTLGLMSLGDINDTNVRAVVNEGDIGTSLLGMAYLNRYQSFEFSNDTLILTR